MNGVEESDENSRSGVGRLNEIYAARLTLFIAGLGRIQVGDPGVVGSEVCRDLFDRVPVDVLRLVAQRRGPSNHRGDCPYEQEEGGQVLHCEKYSRSISSGVEQGEN